MLDFAESIMGIFFVGVQLHVAIVNYPIKLKKLDIMNSVHRLAQNVIER